MAQLTKTSAITQPKSDAKGSSLKTKLELRSTMRITTK